MEGMEQTEQAGWDGNTWHGQSALIDPGDVSGMVNLED